MVKTSLAVSVAALVALSASALVAQRGNNEAREALIARAKSLELPTKYVPPPGEKIEHYASGYAKIMCTAVFVTGLDPAFAAENVGYFTAPYAERARLGTPKIDRQKRTVEVTMPNGSVRLAKQVGSQGCITVPIGKTDVFFKPSTVSPNLPDPKTTPWPMGDAAPGGPAPTGFDAAKVQAGRRSRVRSGRDDRRVRGDLQRADHRRALRRPTSRRLRRSRAGRWGRASAARCSESDQAGRLHARSAGADSRMAGAGRSAAEDPHSRHPEHVERPSHHRAAGSGLRANAAVPGSSLLLHGRRSNAFKYAATRPQQWPPATVGRYRNTDPVLTNYLVRLAVEKRGENYHAFPQRALFDKIGMRTMSSSRPIRTGTS